MNNESILETIMSTWDGLCIEYPAIRDLSTWIYKVNQKTRAIICCFDYSEPWSQTLDVPITERQFKDLLTLENMHLNNVIIAVTYNDRKMFARVMDFYEKKDTFIQEGIAYLPKEHFELIQKKVKK